MHLFINLFVALMCCISGIKTTLSAPAAFDAFSNNYYEARTKFYQASLASGGRIESIHYPVDGPDNKPLYTDITLIGPDDAETVLVISSGTHGVEGFAGSGIQIGLLRDGIASRLPANTSVLMIHAISPYGFAHIRRYDEKNVDLNRNFVDHSMPYPGNKGYDELAKALSPDSLSIWETVKAYWSIASYWLRHGRDQLSVVISGGQYSHPEGLFFGGNTESWSNTMLRRVVRQYLSNSRRVVFVDVHTGLGPYAEAEVILNEDEKSPSYLRAVNWWGERVKTTVSNASVSVHIAGSLKLALPKMLPHVEVTAVSLEFGTYSQKEVLIALRNENWLFHYDDVNHPDTEAIKKKLLDVFYPNTAQWKARVWAQGKEVIDQAIEQIQ